jgi:hypothetical protein
VKYAYSDYRDHYFPGTEELEPDEMRVIALGTGMPITRKSQASASFLVQLGNGENFLFDIMLGTYLHFGYRAGSVREQSRWKFGGPQGRGLNWEPPPSFRT